MQPIIPKIDRQWTLFLDRDGVINKRLVADYVKTPQEFEFMPDAPQTIGLLRLLFGRVVIVTNQQGIGKKLMTEAALDQVHQKMLLGLQAHCPPQYLPVIDRIYFCPALSSELNPCRKPQIGMALQAKADFPEIDFTKSVMIGDSLSDIEFGKNAQMLTLMFGGQYTETADFHANNWQEVRALFNV